MLDIKYIRQNQDLVQKGTDQKGFRVSVDAILSLDDQIRQKKQLLEEKQAIRNRLSKEIGATPQDQEKKQEVLSMKKGMELLEQEIGGLQQSFQELMFQLAQPAAPDVPIGKSDQENVPIKHWGEPKPLDQTPKDHMALGDALGLLDFERGVKISGSRSYILKGKGALLEQAILRMSYDYLLGKGFTPLAVPILVNESAMEGTGYFPLGRDQAYLCERDKMALVGTSEVSLCSYHAQETLSEKELPIRYMGMTSCFRREAGSYGKDTKGLYRVHQFQKIEMVILGVQDPEDSQKLHAELLSHAEWILQALELPYRVVYVCTGDLGQGQVRKHDIETWMPSRKGYGETHSCSTFYDFQARRLQIRYKKENGSERPFVYTLNNTACAIPRLILALLENHQTKSGRVRIPKALQGYFGSVEI